ITFTLTSCFSISLTFISQLFSGRDRLIKNPATRRDPFLKKLNLKKASALSRACIGQYIQQAEYYTAFAPVTILVVYVQFNLSWEIDIFPECYSIQESNDKSGMHNIPDFCYRLIIL
ncbi:hypothetical protein R1T16_13890, partial [Flavobacterium sp. DG1-102-2]|uniref:hypothetical protein n=1 Tax=Flavobacterium sp. DG1-102-2 TaxID=3081663 RepID=UPI0029498027